MTAVSLELLSYRPLGSRANSVEIEDEGCEAKVLHGFTHQLPGFEDLVAEVGAEEQLEALALCGRNGHVGRASELRKKAFGDPHD